MKEYHDDVDVMKEYHDEEYQEYHDEIILNVGGDTNIDLVKCPHLLIGGATGSGKSYLMRHILTQLLNYDVKVMVIDPKCVDYQFLKSNDMWLMNGLGLYTREQIENNLVLGLINDLYREMNDRYHYMMEIGITEWNKEVCWDYVSVEGFGNDRLVLVIDELADLIYFDREKERDFMKGKIENLITKISCLGRASGIHLILATQRPDATILGGQLRANIPSRICLRVITSMERRIILGETHNELGERVLLYNGKYTELDRVK